jgi:hypothetical protein
MHTTQTLIPAQDLVQPIKLTIPNESEEYRAGSHRAFSRRDRVASPSGACRVTAAPAVSRR